MLRQLTLLIVALSIVSGCAPVMPEGAASVPLDQIPAANYCQQQGGAVVIRTPAYNTNSDDPLLLANPQPFCEFTSPEDGSMISVLLTTLYAEQPTLAALAYLSKVPMRDNTQPSANPASINCADLGGTSTFGPVSAGGGGWLTGNPDDTYYVIAECVFADGSMLDEWGILYYANGVVRGADLKEKLRFQPAELPALYDTMASADAEGVIPASPAAEQSASGTYVSSVYPAADAAGMVMVFTLYENGNMEQTTLYLGKGNVTEVGVWQTEVDGSITITLTGTTGQTYAEPASITYTRKGDSLVNGVFRLVKLPAVTPEEMNAATSSN